MNRTLSVVGILLTLLYLSSLFFLFYGRLDEISSLRLNEIGDVLAGVFGPVAILWLVLGYFQQGDELRNSTRALELQAEELARSVRGQSEIIEISKKQFASEQEQAAERRRKEREVTVPAIRVYRYWCEPIQDRKYAFFLILENCGAGARNLLLNSFPSGFDVNPSRVEEFAAGEEIKISWVLDFSVPPIGGTSPFWRIKFTKETRRSWFSGKNISGNIFLLSLHYMHGRRGRSSENYEIFFGPPGSNEFRVEKLTREI